MEITLNRFPAAPVIRSAKPSDSEAIIRTHYAAVHETASAAYPSDILEAWSRAPDEVRYEWMRQMITRDEDIVLVAEDESAILGFGILIPQLREIRAIYVHPRYARSGVGGALLWDLEVRAVAQNISSVHLKASLNAEGFYRRHGYITRSRGTFLLPGNYEMACINMDKQLPKSGQ